MSWREHLKAASNQLAEIQSRITRGTGVRLPTDPHHAVIESAEQALAEAERTIAADPIGADELIVRAHRELSSLGGPPDGPRAWRHAAPSGPVMIDELAAAAERFRAAVARLRLTDLIGLLAKVWVAVWGVGILLGLLTPLMPLFILGAGFFVILAGAWFFWRSVASWFWFAGRG